MKKWILYALLLTVSACANERQNKGGEASVEQTAQLEAGEAEPEVDDYAADNAASRETINGYEYVDLGLPSGLKWATCNLGASSPSDYGQHFAWGETSPKFEYTNENCRTLKDAMSRSISGNEQCDAARANWGGSWRIPTKEEMEELVKVCTWTWTTHEGHRGYLVTGPNGRSIFLPAAGCRGGRRHLFAEELGQYWSAMPVAGNRLLSYCLDISSQYHSVYERDRVFGYSIRPVSGNDEKEAVQSDGSPVASETTTVHEYVNLGLPSGVKWATCNVGASSPSDYGHYFAWGETKPKMEFWGATSKTYGRKVKGFSGSTSYDAARANWGGRWRMPTQREMEELAEKCTWTWTTQGGHSGYVVTGPSDQSIFLPAAGYCEGDSLARLAGELGRYWCSEPSGLYEGHGSCLWFKPGHHSLVSQDRYYGLSVRPVID